MSQAASMVDGKGAWIDINAGCPVKKVIKKGAGSALLKDLKKLKKIIEGVKNNVKSKVSVKVRLGFDEDNFERIYDAAVEAGADMIAVHGRTAKQMYSGRAKWQIKNKGYIPLYINGDIYNSDNIKIAMELSGADGVLIARGAIGNPWIFSNITPSIFERKNVVLQHIDLLYLEVGDIREFRKFVAGYTKGLPGARQFRAKVMKIEEIDELKMAFEEYFLSISN